MFPRTIKTQHKCKNRLITFKLFPAMGAFLFFILFLFVVQGGSSGRAGRVLSGASPPCGYHRQDGLARINRRVLTNLTTVV